MDTPQQSDPRNLEMTYFHDFISLIQVNSKLDAYNIL